MIIGRSYKDVAWTTPVKNRNHNLTHHAGLSARHRVVSLGIPWFRVRGCAVGKLVWEIDYEHIDEQPHRTDFEAIEATSKRRLQDTHPQDDQEPLDMGRSPRAT